MDRSRFSRRSIPGEHGSGELDDTVGVSHDTVSKVLGELDDFGLVQPTALRDERGTTHTWELTGKGARVRRILEKLGIVKHYRLIQMYRNRIEDAEPEFLERVAELE